MNELLKNKVILITGGTGFLGRSLVKQIVKYEPQSIRVFSRDEVKHHKFKEWFINEPELKQYDYDKYIRNFIGDVRDYERLKKAMRNVDYVIHAAALKRLDLLEYNVEESIKTNILGTVNVVNAAFVMNVDKAIFVSTDKACSPINTYGACKFVSERIFTESNYSKGDKKTVFTCVRYGNVLESTGSVIPFFETKINNGEKIPLTDSRMTRFIISPEQAVELIFNAIRYSVGGEIFVPKLPAFNIVDLIDILKEKNHKQNEIEVIGIRPGEKIHELMINRAEVPRTFEFEDFFVITSSIERWICSKKLNQLEEGTILDVKKIKEYSSKDAVISKEKIKKLFRELKII